MFCANCGNSVGKNTKFCSQCGTAISSLVDDSIAGYAETKKVDSTTMSSGAEIGSEQYLPNLIQEKSRRRLFFGLVLLMFAGLILLTQYNYILNLLSGPRLLNAITLESELISGEIKDINVNLPLITDSVYSTGYTHVTTTTNRYTNQVENKTTDSQYYITIIGSHMLILQGVPNQLPTGNFIGAISPIDQSLQGKIIADFNSDPKLAGLTDKILPYVLSNKGITGLDQFWTVLFGVAIGCWGGFIVYRRLEDPKDRKNYIYEVVNSAGYKDIYELSHQFCREKDNTISIDNYELSKNFLFKEDFFFFNIYPTSELYWAYKKVTRTSVNFIPTGKNFELVMHFKPKITVGIKESEQMVNQHLMLLIRLFPKVKFGYTK